MAAALASGVARPETRVAPCYGSYQYGGRSFGCWKHAGHGSLNFIEAIEKSCDVYFYQMGPRVGLDRLSACAKAFGLGSRTGVDLPQERRGLIPDQAYYDKRWGANQYPKGLLLNLAIGQGELLVTPMQLALLGAEVARSGTALRPHVVQRVVGEADFAPAKPMQTGMTADAAVWRALHDGLQRVVDTGTATLAKVPGLTVAGKTGTAQNPHGQDHALFLCYAPADNPQIALAFVIENSGHGGTICAPRAGAVLKNLFLADSTQKVTVPRAAADSLRATSGD
jgi:penicillin-binding protein 2